MEITVLNSGYAGARLKYRPVFFQPYTMKAPVQTEVGRADGTSSVVSNAQVGVGGNERQAARVQCKSRVCENCRVLDDP